MSNTLVLDHIGEHYDKQILPNVNLQMKQPLLSPILTDFNSQGTRFICEQNSIPGEVHELKNLPTI